jgi:outer membrane protein insertion porin family/translocation and assembly module TamA
VLLTTEVPPEGSPVLGYREARASTGVNRTLWKLFGEVTYNIQWNNPFTYVGPKDPTLQNLTISYVDFLTIFDFRNDKVHPRRGFYLGNELQLSGGVLGGDAQDIRVQPDVRGYLPVAKRVTLAVRGSTGFLFPTSYGRALDQSPGAGQAPPGIDKSTWAKDTEIVFFRALFAGGPNSDRGWPLRGIGPHGVAPFFSPSLQAQQIALHCAPSDPQYDSSRCAVPLGGLTLWEAQAELRFPIINMLEGAGFCDSADVTPKQVTYRFEARRLHLSCGLGLRYDTPVGPIRLDVAYRVPPLNPTQQDIANGEDGNPGTIFGAPIGVAFGIGEAF